MVVPADEPGRRAPAKSEQAEENEALKEDVANEADPLPVMGKGGMNEAELGEKESQGDILTFPSEKAPVHSPAAKKTESGKPVVPPSPLQPQPSFPSSGNASGGSPESSEPAAPVPVPLPPA